SVGGCGAAGSQLLSRRRFPSGCASIANGERAISRALAITVIPSEAKRSRGTLRNHFEISQRDVSTSFDMTETILRSQTAAVIPAYQDEKHIGDIARRTRERLDHVLVVDHGSTHQPPHHPPEAAAVGVHHQNQGKGEAIKTGRAHWLGAANPSSSGQDRQITWVILLDSDGQHLPEEIDRFLLAAASVTRPTFFIGNRMNDVARMPFIRRLVSRYMSSGISRVCGQ